MGFQTVSKIDNYPTIMALNGWIKRWTLSTGRWSSFESNL